MASPNLTQTRIDKWLWAARMFKTRTLATTAVDGGTVHLNGVRVKPAREVKAGDRIRVSTETGERELIVVAIGERRGSAPEAQKLYEETAESIARREAAREARQLGVEPAGERHGRPTKRDRRTIERWRDQ
ncbi:RNA-binding S4 domain-containing protein [Niveibacterium terrae]|uniref:RNA-binding S4 domain-containing protein n=1 Tax=Niveibacterium terrae TaxID=3373598 RepID=UPI003A95BFC5